MEREKRKRASPVEIVGGVVVEETKKRKKTREAAATTAEEPTTEEVEEFYAILRRMHAAMRYLKGAEKRLMDGKPAAETTAVVREKKELDLNEVPADSAN